MAWRIDESVIRGEIDNRTRGRVTGRIWFVGLDDPVELDFTGNAWRDLAGRRLEFTNPEPKPLPMGFNNFARRQTGTIGDCTASRKVKVPEVSMDELMELYEQRKPFPWHWGNSLYLEWIGDNNGRVVIESASYTLTISPEVAWDMTPDEEVEQRKENTRSIEEFFGHLTAATDQGEPKPAEDADTDEEEWQEEKPMTEAEAEKMHEESERLVDRIQARLEREGPGADYEKILREELERRERERGETPLTPEQEAEIGEWMDEANRAGEDAAQAAKEDDADLDDDDDDHPLAQRTYELTLRLMQEPEQRGWIPVDATAEHPLIDLGGATAKAGAKLAGALNGEAWPPDLDECATIIVRLKRARGYLDDALRAAGDCVEQKLGDGAWLEETRAELNSIALECDGLLAELRGRLEKG
jgi:hypothetical protein